MARPKKYKEDTEVVSFRVPKKMIPEIRKVVTNTLTQNIHLEVQKIQSVVTEEVEIRIKEMEQELSQLDPNKGSLAKRRIAFLTNQIFNLKRTLK